MTKLPYLASAASLWRGYDYYTDHKVLSWEPTESGERPQQFDGVVSGNGDKPYEVHIDIAHPKKSTCTCPFADLAVREGAQEGRAAGGALSSATRDR